jgi:GntR family transcriptional repressor for pyruvate dehydrogenase complex
LGKKLTYEAVYDEIKRRIKTGSWKAGDRLPPIEQLSQQLGVGISSVREAIRVLGKQGILKIEQGRGTFVRDALQETPEVQFDFLESASLLQLTEARSIIEPQLAALAAERGTAEELKAIVQNTKQMKQKVEAGVDFLQEDLEFHELIAKAAGNHVLYQMLNLIRDLLLDSRRRSMKWKGMDEKAVSYHTLIAQAIEGRNPTQAAALMKVHMEDMKQELEAEASRHSQRGMNDDEN